MIDVSTRNSHALTDSEVLADRLSSEKIEVYLQIAHATLSKSFFAIFMGTLLIVFGIFFRQSMSWATEQSFAQVASIFWIIQGFYVLIGAYLVIQGVSCLVEARIQSSVMSKALQLKQVFMAWDNGDQRAKDQLFPLIYDELHRLAHNFMWGERAGQTIQVMDLVNETYLRLVEVDNMQTKNRQQFMRLAATVMRRVLVDLARERSAQRCVHHPQQVSLAESIAVTPDNLVEILAIDEALEKLLHKHPRQGRVFELKFVGGYADKEIAEMLEVAQATVKGDWKFAQLWMKQELQLSTGGK